MYINNIPVTAGLSYPVQVGAGGFGQGSAGTESFFWNTTTMRAGGGLGGIYSGAAPGGTAFASASYSSRGAWNGGIGGSQGWNSAVGDQPGGGGGAGGYSGESCHPTGNGPVLAQCIGATGRHDGLLVLPSFALCDTSTSSMQYSWPTSRAMQGHCLVAWYSSAVYTDHQTISCRLLK